MLDIDRRRDAAARFRVVGATWGSVVLHVSCALIIAAIVAPKRGVEIAPSSERKDASLIVWLESPEPPGGGGSDGDRTPEPAHPAERPGTARLTVPAKASRSSEPRTVSDPPIQEIHIPAVPEASGLREVPGAVSDVTRVNVATRGPGARGGAGDGDGDGLDRGFRTNWGGGRPGAGAHASSPELIKQVRPNYTSSAMQARVRGVVVMDAVVLPDGSVGEVKIVRSLDRTFGLDQEAIKAVRQWRFRPATRAGYPIAMLVSVEMLFELR